VSSDEDVEKVSQEEERTTIAAEFEASEVDPRTITLTLTLIPKP